jgi:pSer/pThr/pTyr-binding forkhead associated (FHA) protein
MHSAQKPRARLFHLQTITGLDLPENLMIIRIGKAVSTWSPNIDVSTFPNSDIVSLSHAQICMQENNYFIKDLASTNGTSLNHSLLRPFILYQLRFGDRIDLGKDKLFTFLFQRANLNGAKRRF